MIKIRRIPIDIFLYMRSQPATSDNIVFIFEFSFFGQFLLFVICSMFVNIVLVSIWMSVC